MELQQLKATDKLLKLIRKSFPNSKAYFTGSVLKPDLMDAFSDVDITVDVSDDEVTGVDVIMPKLIETFGNVFGYQIINNATDDVLRICFDTGIRFDITFVYSSARVLIKKDCSINENTETNINLYWFLSSLILDKLGRSDNLTASHLVFELCQIIIVIQMLLRDEAKKTNIHKSGDNECVPILTSLLSANISSTGNDKTKNEILGILFLASKHMDDLAGGLLAGYESKTEKLIKKCVECDL